MLLRADVEARLGPDSRDAEISGDPGKHVGVSGDSIRDALVDCFVFGIGHAIVVAVEDQPLLDGSVGRISSKPDSGTAEARSLDRARARGAAPAAGILPSPRVYALAAVGSRQPRSRCRPCC